MGAPLPVAPAPAAGPTTVDSPHRSNSSVPRVPGPGGVSPAGSARHDEAHGLGTRRRITELATDRGRERLRSGLADTAHRHAHVLALDDHDDPARLQDRHQGLGDLRGETLLDLRPPGVDVDQPRQLREPGDLAGGRRDVAHVRDPAERNQVVLTGTEHLDVLDQHHLVVAEIERRRQDVLGLLVEAREYLLVRTCHSARRLAQALTVGVLADSDEELPNSRLGPLLVENADRALPVERHRVGHSVPRSSVQSHARTRPALTEFRQAQRRHTKKPRPHRLEPGGRGIHSGPGGGPVTGATPGRAGSALGTVLGDCLRGRAVALRHVRRGDLRSTRTVGGAVGEGELLGREHGRTRRRGAPGRTGPRRASRALHDRGEDLGDLLLAERLLLEELEDQGVEDVAVLDENLPRVVVRGLDELLDLFVDERGDLFRVVALVSHLPAHERLGVVSTELDRTEALRHAVLRDHRAGRGSGLLDVVGGTGRRVVEDQLLGRAPAQHVRQLVEHLVARRGVLVLLREHHRVTEGTAAGEDRDLVDRVRLGRGRRDQGVSALVVRGDLLLLLGHDPGPLLRTRHDAVDGLVEHLVVDELPVAARREERRFVQHVRQIGTGEAGRTTGDRVEVDVLRDRLALLVHLEDLEAALHVRTVDGDLPVETPRTQQRRVQDVRPVRGGDQDDAALHVEAVHLDEQLIERLLALVVTAAHAGTAVPSDGVDLVDEDDRRSVRLGLLEEVTDTGGTDTDEHLDEVGTGDRVERDARLARDRA